MKKLILIVSILLVIVIAGSIEQVHICKTLDELELRADTIYSQLQAEQYDDALQSTSDLSIWWERERDQLEFLCPNTDIKEIYREIGELQGSQLATMYDDSITRANVLKYMAKNTKNLLKFKLKNIL